LYNEALTPEDIMAIYTAELESESPVILSVTMILEGPYDSSSEMMKDDLRVTNNIPLEQPYSALGYGVPFAITDNTLLSTNGPSAIVDWIIVELRDAIDPSTIIESQACLLQRDGTVVSALGNPVSFGIENSEVFVAVRHRNHFGVRTNQTYSTSSLISVDFSDLMTGVYGEGSINQIDGTRVLISGDANSDGQINTIDKNSFWRLQNAQMFDYLGFGADFNLDGAVNSIDRNLYWRLNNSKVEQLD